MGQDLFRKLPPEITIEILSRLPIHKATRCKLVAKSWRSLIESPEFANAYKSTPHLALTDDGVEGHPFLYKVYDVEDGDGNLKKNSRIEAYNFSFPHRVPLHNSVDGLVFMFPSSMDKIPHLFVWNPITSEYISICSPRRGFVDHNFGFGVSKKSGQYKIVSIPKQYPRCCQVYTLGTGLWRSVGHSLLDYVSCFGGALVNGNLHWLAYCEKGRSWISCFDLETERFTTLSASRPGKIPFCQLRALRNCLGIFDYYAESEIVIWLMKDYGDDKSWTKQFVISIVNHPSMRVIHVFRDGVVLLRGLGATGVFCYSDKTKTIKEADDLIQLQGLAYVILGSYTPSFLPLKTFSSTENVMKVRIGSTRG